MASKNKINNINQSESMNGLNIKESNHHNTYPTNNKYYLFQKIKHTVLWTNKLDYYANAVPFGSFCFAITFILYGFYECKVHQDEDLILYTTILLFGGLGQVTAGIFEYVKSRTYPCALYFTYGLYCFSFFYLKYNYETDKDKYFVFYASWSFLSLPICISSIKTNIFLIIQTFASTLYFISKCIGFSRDIDPMKETVAGIFGLIAGFSSLYISFGQLLNEHYGFPIFPAIPLLSFCIRYYSR